MVPAASEPPAAQDPNISKNVDNSCENLIQPNEIQEEAPVQVLIEKNDPANDQVDKATPDTEVAAKIEKEIPVNVSDEKVKAEIENCDVVAMKKSSDDEENYPPTIVELKLSLNLNVILQAVDRLLLSPVVYIGVPHNCGALKKQRKRIIKLLKMLGIGLLVIEIAFLGFATFVLFFVGLAMLVTGGLMAVEILPQTITLKTHVSSQ